MIKSVFDNPMTELLSDGYKKILNEITLAICEAIIKLGGFDNFLNTLDMNAVAESEKKSICPELMKYIAEKENQKGRNDGRGMLPGTGNQQGDVVQ